MWRWLAVVVAALALSLAPFHAAAKESGSAPDWSAVIPDAFPGDIFVWRLAADGTYAEDGYDAASGAAIQETLTGRWREQNGRLILAQDTLGFVFVGTIDGERYTGVLYQNGRQVSRFCALRGAAAPTTCGLEVGV